MVNYKLALFLYNEWVRNKKNDGFHEPSKCPTVIDGDDKLNVDIIHCSKCCSELCGFESLDKSEKDEYFSKAMDVLSGIEAVGLVIIEK